MKINFLFKRLLSLSFFFVLFSCKSKNPEINSTQQPFKIAFGSCINQNNALDILDTVLMYQPDVFVFLGDNVYADTREVDVFKNEYNKLKAKPSFNRLIDHVPVFATWDDHDYGENDAGKYYPLKEDSRQIFLDFWNVPDSSERRNHQGVYDAVFFSLDTLVIQLILLDTRSFRDNLVKNFERKKRNANTCLCTLLIQASLVKNNGFGWQNNLN